jgi:hypothetical protein
VPIPPLLAKVLRAHIEDFGVANSQGRSRPCQRTYDLRHTCTTNRLNAAVPVAEVARAGNSPEVIHRRYEGCIDVHEELNNKKIE